MSSNSVWDLGDDYYSDVSDDVSTIVGSDGVIEDDTPLLAMQRTGTT